MRHSAATSGRSTRPVCAAFAIAYSVVSRSQTIPMLRGPGGSRLPARYFGSLEHTVLGERALRLKEDPLLDSGCRHELTGRDAGLLTDHPQDRLAVSAAASPLASCGTTRTACSAGASRRRRGRRPDGRLAIVERLKRGLQPTRLLDRSPAFDQPRSHLAMYPASGAPTTSPLSVAQPGECRRLLCDQLSSISEWPTLR